jgi:hypothetical protein
MKNPYLKQDTNFLPPKLENIQILEINENVLKTSISNKLGIEFLSTPSNQPTWPVNGIFFFFLRMPFDCCELTLFFT